jgi:IstB-like ATP binding protein
VSCGYPASVSTPHGLPRRRSGRRRPTSRSSPTPSASRLTTGTNGGAAARSAKPRSPCSTGSRASTSTSPPPSARPRSPLSPPAATSTPATRSCCSGRRHRHDPSADRTWQRRLRTGPPSRCATAARLVNELVEAADERRLARLVARYGRLDLLLIDEVGHVQLDTRGAELQFQVLTEREEKSSIGLAATFPSANVAASSLTPASSPSSSTASPSTPIIETGTESYRHRTSRTR